MADQELRIKAIIDDVDDSKLQQRLASLQSTTTKSLSGNSSGNNSQTLIDRQLTQATKLQDRLKVLGEAQAKLANQPGAERQLAKVNQELAGVYSRYKNITSNSNAYLSNLAKEVELRKQATQLTNQANKNEGVYSAHSERQFAMLQQIAGQVPGGGIINRFLGGARQGAMASEAAGGNGGLLSGSAISGGAAAAVAGAAALAVGALVSKMGDLANRAEELAQSASTATSSLGQLRTQMEQTNIRKDMSAVSSGVSIAGVQQWAQDTGNSILGGVIDVITGKSAQDKQKDVSAAISQGLGGDDQETWRRIKEHGQDINVDLARQRQSLDIQQQRQVRDFNLEQKSWQIDIANQKFDLQKNQQRQEQDYALAKKQFDENHAGEMAKKEFDLQQKYATQSFQIQQQRALQDFTLQQQYKAQDYSISKQRAQQDYSISTGDKRYDFQLSQSRNQQEFNINKSRQGQDYRENLMKMAISGADGTSYLFAAMDFNKEQKRQQEDFNRQKAIAQQDYSISAGRDLRNFSLSQSRAAQDYQIGVGRDTQQFGIGQQRASQDFSISRQQAQEQRNLQIEDMLYQRKYEGISLELQHNRNLEDSSIAFQRLNQAIGLQSERFSNQASDINVDQNLQNRDFNINAYRTLRDYGYQQQDFAGAMRQKNPLGAYGETLTDPTFAAASARYAQATGQVPLSGQVAQAQQGIDWGNIIGQAIAQSIPGLSLIGLGTGGFNMAKGGGGGGQVNFNPQTNVTFPINAGVGSSDVQAMMQQYYQAYQKDLNELNNKWAGLFNASMGSNIVPIGW